MAAIFLHGVPDTPALWEPLLKALARPAGEIITPALPGFGRGWPEHFVPTKEGYLDWVLKQVEDAARLSEGPVDLVGHDWGAILALRAASLRPDLVRTWAVADAVIEPGYVWHDLARRWQTPVIGELVMALAPRAALRRALARQGLPQDIARREARAWSGRMKASILRLYRSARTVADDWAAGLGALPARGLVIWGGRDPYIDISFARRFAAARNVPLHVEEGAGHWVVAERPAAVARVLQAHWDGTGARVF